MIARTEALANLVQIWMETGSLSTAADTLVSQAKQSAHSQRNSTAGELLSKLLRIASNTDKAGVLEQLAATILNENAAEAARIIEASGMVLHAYPAMTRKHFLDRIERSLADESRNYEWRLAVARALGDLERVGLLGGEKIALPDLRMPRIELSEPEQTHIRMSTETALLTGNGLPELLGDGELGRLFPSVFGPHERGGIVGRPQHGAHEFPVDVHTLEVVRRVRENPEYAELSQKDKLNVLWVALLHDVGKRASISDPGHEYASADIGWGVLATMGYPIERIQRIANLLSRHTDLSFNPYKRQSETLQDLVRAQELAVYYRHPSAIPQLMILNPADIQSINARSTFWTAPVETELSAVARIVLQQRSLLDNNTIPLLTSKLPSQFGLYSLTGDYGVLVHSNEHSDLSFESQLNLIECSEKSIPASYLTKNHKNNCNSTKRILTIVKAPTEHIVKVGLQGLGNRTHLHWFDHVELTMNNDETKQAFLEDVEQRLRKNNPVVGVACLAELWKQICHFDDLTELLTTGNQHLIEAYKNVVEAITATASATATGTEQSGYNATRVMNPRLAGLGLVRNGSPVVLEGLDDGGLSALANRNEIPDWLHAGSKAPENALIVPQLVWQETQRRNLPIVSLD